MRCSVTGCVGKYEKRHVDHTVRHNGEVIVVEGVPAEVCTMCGDVLFDPETVRQLEEIIESSAQPHQTVPLYQFADGEPAANK